MAYTDPEANFDLIIENFNGYSIIGTEAVPVVTCSVGRGLFRALFENPTGLTQDEITTGLPSATTTALSNGSRFVVAPVHLPGLVTGANYANGPFGAGDDDGMISGVVIVDPTYTSTSPNFPIPNFQDWCTKLGGTYIDLLF